MYFEIYSTTRKQNWKATGESNDKTEKKRDLKKKKKVSLVWQRTCLCFKGSDPEKQWNTYVTISKYKVWATMPTSTTLH